MQIIRMQKEFVRTLKQKMYVNIQQNLIVLYTFVPNESFGQLLDISHKNFKFLQKSDLEFSDMFLIIRKLFIRKWASKTPKS